MTDGLQKLKDIGAQKIHEKTHISRQHVQGILYESFEGMNKIQFIGFISILEREYALELDNLKANGLEYFSGETSYENPNNQVFVVPKKKKNFTMAYILSVVFIFLAVAIYSINSSSSTAKIQDTKLRELAKSAQQNSIEEVASVDMNISAENNTSLVVAEEIKPEVLEVPKSLKIVPKVAVWVGYIELDTHKKHQTTVKHNLTLDTSKEWILVFGHGNIDIEVNGEKRSFNTAKNLRFVYRDGNLTKISFTEFKRLNKGNIW